MTTPDPALDALVPDGLRAALGPDGVARLHEAWQAGQAAHPTLSLGAGEWLSELVARLGADGAGEGAADHVAALRPDDFYLAAACLRGVPGAIDAAVALAVGQARGTLEKTAGGSRLAAELTERLGAALTVPADDRPALLASYDGRGSLGDFIRARGIALGLEWARAEVVSRLTSVAASARAAASSASAAAGAAASAAVGSAGGSAGGSTGGSTGPAAPGAVPGPPPVNPLAGLADVLRSALDGPLAEAKHAAAQAASATLARFDQSLGEQVAAFQRRLAELRAQIDEASGRTKSSADEDLSG
jgi:hypothetical protein